MLVDQKNGYILSFLRESVKCFLNGRSLCLLVDDEKVALRVRRFCYMADSCEEETSYRVLQMPYQLRSPAGETMEVRTSSPITARNCRSLYADGGAAMLILSCAEEEQHEEVKSDSRREIVGWSYEGLLASSQAPSEVGASVA